MNLATSFSQQFEKEEEERSVVENNSKRLKEVVAENGERKEEGKARDVSRCWPRDWLPQDCPGARVIALNYTTDPYLWRPVWMNKRCR